MTLEQLYQQAGGSCAETLRRIPSEAMLRRFILKFQDDPAYKLLCDSVQAQDWATAFRAAHTMKGVAQNLGFDGLYRSSAELTEHLRGEKPLTEPALLDAVTADYQALLAAISQLEQ